MKPKYAILVGDGMADLPVHELGGKTPLAYAATPNMGLVATVPAGMPPGSDVANLSLMGYDPARYYSGRAPIEAASMGVRLSPADTAFRCNLVTITSGRMTDYSAGHIETETAGKIIQLLKAQLDGSGVCFYPGVSYRHLLVLKNFPDKCECTPPHDISDREIAGFLPKGPGSDLLVSLMDRARQVIGQAGTATDIWLWGNGRAMSLPTLKERYALSGSVISAVDLVRGLGVLAGLQVRIVKGATGYLGTNYAGKVAAARAALAVQDFVFLHVEAPDETSHEGSLRKKITAIEEFDRHIVGEMLNFQKDACPELQLLVAPDHATPVSLKTHHAAPVPYAACGQGIRPEHTKEYSEESAAAAAQKRGRPALGQVERLIFSGCQLFDRFIKQTLQA
jgi:2,3-bisphosphoglycerate-independent phosphoglycerate mutase